MEDTVLNQFQAQKESCFQSGAREENEREFLHCGEVESKGMQFLICRSISRFNIKCAE